MSDISDNDYLRNLYSEQQADESDQARQAIFSSQVGLVMASLAALDPCEYGGGLTSKKRRRGKPEGAKNVKRTRLDVDRHSMMMDKRLFRKKYRMDKTSFHKLLDILEPYLPSTGEERSRPGSVPNGPITKSSRLSMALRYCAGGDPLDICDHHGVNDYEVVRSVWFVVDAINKAPQMNIEFPRTHEGQAIIAEGFKKKSDIDIDVCVGAIDGMLVWIHQPSKSDIKVIEFGPAKFFCGRKKKFGMNLQAVCDARGRFLDVDMSYPGATSDFFAFDQSEVKTLLEQDGFLHPGYCLFGDNAYVSTPYMCVPFRNVPGGSKEDAFNFFQSQLRINIECAFGMLVHRFGILRKAIPRNIDVFKTNCLVLALCKLHNFCIDQDDCIDFTDKKDLSNIMKEGGMYRPRIDDDGEAAWAYHFDLSSSDRVSDLLDGGDHTEDHNRGQRRQYRRGRYRREAHLPRDLIYRVVCDNGFKRPPRSSLRRVPLARRV